MLRNAIRGALAILGLYVLAVGYQLWSIHHDLTRAETAASGLTLESIDGADGIRAIVDPVLGSIDDAAATADSPLLGALTPIPVAGDQIDGVRSLTGRLEEISTTTNLALVGVEAALDAAGDDGGKVALTSAGLDAVGLLRDEVSLASTIDTSTFLGPLRRAADRFDGELLDADQDLAELEQRLAVARDLLVGPTRILVLAANNAEIRAGMGMHLSAGVVTITDGDFDTSDFVSTTPLGKQAEGRAEVPSELERMYRRIWDFGREWRTTSTSPNFPAVGAIFADLARRTPIGDVDLILSIDAPALGDLLEATGPVEVEGRAITADNAVDVLLRDNYLELGDPSQSPERRELQSEVATAIFDAVTQRDVDVIELATGLADAADGRHVLAWSADPAVQELIEALGADGALTDRSMLVSFQNATASKRDYYIDTRVRLEPVEGAAPGSRRFRATATLENPVVDPTAPYVDSLNRFVPVGVHRAFVTFTLPGGVTDIEVLAADLSTIGTDGPTTVANLWLRVPEGTSGDATIEFTVPSDLQSVEVLPSARVRPTTYEFGPVSFTDQVARSVALPSVPTMLSERRAQQPQLPEAGALIVFFMSLVLWVHRSRRLSAPDADLDAAAADARLAQALLLFALALTFLAATQ